MTRFHSFERRANSNSPSNSYRFDMQGACAFQGKWVRSGWCRQDGKWLVETAENSHSSSWQRKSFSLLHFAVIFLRTSVKLPWKSTEDSESTKKRDANAAGISVKQGVRVATGIWWQSDYMTCCTLRSLMEEMKLCCPMTTFTMPSVLWLRVSLTICMLYPLST